MRHGKYARSKVILEEKFPRWILSCQVPGIPRSVLGLFGLVSMYFEWNSKFDVQASDGAAAHKTIQADPSLRYDSQVPGMLSKPRNYIWYLYCYTGGSRPEWCISTVYQGFSTRMVYLYYIPGFPDQNGVSLLYTGGSRPEWCISTVYQGFSTRMVYLYYIPGFPDQNGVSLLYTGGSRPEWCISTIYQGFSTRMVYLYYIPKVINQNGVSLLYTEGSRPEWCVSTIYWGFSTRMVYLYYMAHSCEKYTTDSHPI